MSASGPQGLPAVLKRIERRHRDWHWHCFVSNEGHLYAASPRSPYGWSGITVHAESPLDLEQEIANVERLGAGRYAA